MSDTISPREGGVYLDRNGFVHGPLKPDSIHTWVAGGRSWDAQGKWHRDGSHLDLIREVFITDKPPQVCPELKAGGRYETVKPDGTPGPVVELHQPSFSVEGIRDYFCFSSAIKNDTLYITAGGLCVGNCEPGNRYQITREYVEPKPPSLAERLENWRNDASKSYAEIDSIISDVRKLEAKS